LRIQGEKNPVGAAEVPVLFGQFEKRVRISDRMIIPKKADFRGEK
jgi:hypothetical protein